MIKQFLKAVWKQFGTILETLFVSMVVGIGFSTGVAFTFTWVFN